MTGCESRLVFVAWDNPGMAIRRVVIRVAKGGHDTPKETMLRCEVN